MVWVVVKEFVCIVVVIDLCLIVYFDVVVVKIKELKWFIEFIVVVE